MDTDHEQRVRARLAAARRRAELLGQQHERLAEQVRLDVPDDEHDPDGATLGLERAQVRALRARATAEVAALEAALVRLVDGTAAVCDDCGGTIAAARLAALPGATRCIACARAADGAR